MKVLHSLFTGQRVIHPGIQRAGTVVWADPYRLTVSCEWDGYQFPAQGRAHLAGSYNAGDLEPEDAFYYQLVQHGRSNVLGLHCMFRHLPDGPRCCRGPTHVYSDATNDVRYLCPAHARSYKLGGLQVFCKEMPCLGRNLTHPDPCIICAAFPDLVYP